MQRIILHLDMNSYFASVEQQANPFFRNKPVGACAYLSKNGCIIASSIEAKKVGIKTGCRVPEAKKLYPKVILVENDPDKYRTVTKKLFEIMNSYSGTFEPYSIDEAFLDLTGWAKDFNQAKEIAIKIQQRINVEIGSWLKCSIGISFTKFLAKFASDVTGSGQILVIAAKSELNDIYQQYKLTDLWGINFRLEKRLNALGIKTILDLKNYSVQNLIQAFGKYGYWLYCYVNGLEVGYLRSSNELLSKSIGHSYCLPRQTTDKKYLFSILYKLVAKVGVRLRERQQVAGGVFIHWSYSDHSGFSKRFKLKRPIQTTGDIFEQVYRVFNQAKLTDPLSLLATGVFGLSEPTNQLSIFDISRRDDNLTKALDQINNIYRSQMIYCGWLWKTENLARDRIGFRKVEL